VHPQHLIEEKGALVEEGPLHDEVKGVSGMGATGRASVEALAAIALMLAAPAGAASGQGTGRWRAVEVVLASNAADEAILGRPLAMALDEDRLFIADAQDCAVKVFAKDGTYLRSLGRKGGGPGELSFPSGVSVVEGRVHVADKFNSRIAAFDREGRWLGAFAVPFLPDKVLALDAETLLVTGNPTGRRANEALLHIYDTSGRLRWAGLEARSSSDPMFDTFRNMILVCPGDGTEFYVVFRTGDRTIYRFAATGLLLERIEIDERYAFRPLDMPFKGPKKRLLGLCWAAARAAGIFYLASPEPVEGKDLGPGRCLSALDRAGRLQAIIELPCPIHRFVVEGKRLYCIDDGGELRLFEVVR
jgi:hypothetical protein